MQVEHVLFVEARVFATGIWNVDFGAANRCKRFRRNDQAKRMIDETVLPSMESNTIVDDQEIDIVAFLID